MSARDHRPHNDDAWRDDESRELSFFVECFNDKAVLYDPENSEAFIRADLGSVIDFAEPQGGGE